MKRVGYLMPEIVEWENLLLAFCRAERGLSDKHEADVYRANLDENLRFLGDGLILCLSSPGLEARGDPLVFNNRTAPSLYSTCEA